MSALVRSSFQAFTLAMLACACMMVAQTANTVLSGTLFSLPAAQSVPRQEPPPASKASTASLSEKLLARYTGLPLTDHPKPAAMLPQNARPSPLAIQLLGTMTSRSPDLSLASLYDSAALRTRTVRVGSTIQQAEVLSIEHTRVLLSNGGRVEVIEFTSPSSADKTTASPLPPSAPAGASTGFGSTLRQTGPESYTIRRQDVENTLANLNQVAMQARIVPAFRDGVSQGFKLFAMKPDSLFARLGMQNGDILQRVNGLTLDGPERALEVYARLRSASRIELELDRNGQTLHKTYTVEE
jgi:general secretion pathway protein C